MEINADEIDRIVLLALEEDIGTGDATTDAIVSEDSVSNAEIKAKEDGVIAGLIVAERVFKLLDERIDFIANANDGDSVSKGQTIALISGSSRAILSAERVALNFLQRLSGIATITSKCTQVVKECGSNAKILDTRKTTPGLRALEKYAVRLGGGENHRFGLYDMILIKDNHIKADGGIAGAIASARKKYPQLKVEVEVETLEQCREALNSKPDRIMLDNMSPEMMRECVKMIDGACEIEASGGINLENLKDVAKTEVDYISLGSITHSPKALDISMEFCG